MYSPAPEVVGNDVPKEVVSDSGIANEAVARAEVPLTPDAPTTSLQIRLVDGTRLIATFNHSHTIGDVRRYIIAYPLIIFILLDINFSILHWHHKAFLAAVTSLLYNIL